MDDWARASSIPKISQIIEAGASETSIDTFAGFWLRLFAVIIDGSILGSFRYVLALIFGVSMAANGITDIPTVPLLISILIDWIYFALFESSAWQGTLGKKALGVKVTDMHGERISFAGATARYFSKYVSSLILMIGFIMAGFTERKQALHDMMAGTLVICQWQGTPPPIPSDDSEDNHSV